MIRAGAVALGALVVWTVLAPAAQAQDFEWEWTETGNEAATLIQSIEPVVPAGYGEWMPNLDFNYQSEQQSNPVWDTITCGLHIMCDDQTADYYAGLQEANAVAQQRALDEWRQGIDAEWRGMDAGLETTYGDQNRQVFEEWRTQRDLVNWANERAGEEFAAYGMYEDWYGQIGEHGVTPTVLLDDSGERGWQDVIRASIEGGFVGEDAAIRQFFDGSVSGKNIVETLSAERAAQIAEELRGWEELGRYEIVQAQKGVGQGPDQYGFDPPVPQTGDPVHDFLRRSGRTIADYAGEGLEWLFRTDDVAVDPDERNVTVVPKTLPISDEERARLQDEQDSVWDEKMKHAQEEDDRLKQREFVKQQADWYYENVVRPYEEEAADAWLQYEAERDAEKEIEEERAAREVLDIEYQLQTQEFYASEGELANNRALLDEALDRENERIEAERRAEQEARDEAFRREQAELDARAREQAETAKAEFEFNKRDTWEQWTGPYPAEIGSWWCRESASASDPSCWYRGPDGMWRTNNPYFDWDRETNEANIAFNSWDQTSIDAERQRIIDEDELARQLRDQRQVSLGEQEVRFDFGRYEIRNDARPTLDRLANVLTSPAYNDSVIIVFGHTDSVGTDANNLLLSQNRAQSVAGYLSSANDSLLAGRVLYFGLGEHYADQAYNPLAGEHRRVQILVIPNVGP